MPITFNIYSVGPDNSVGALIATDTQTFTIPYRPSSDPAECSDGTSWYDSATAACYHGLDTNVSFDFSSQSFTLPGKVIYGIAYNTTHYGYQPIGESASCYGSSAGCGYDSLNIALAPQVYTGSQAVPGTVYQNSPYGNEYCDQGAAGTGTFRLDSPSSAFVVRVCACGRVLRGQPASLRQPVQERWLDHIHRQRRPALQEPG